MFTLTVRVGVIEKENFPERVEMSGVNESVL